ncbi:glycosyltransferase [Candidatus Dojkabacteria bacterium]|nr:glycosyltransferase [Candidatus Dojkabacteria bacterium]
MTKYKKLNQKKLSIIIPCFNEKNTIIEIIKKIEKVNLGTIEKEIIIVDDGSDDGTNLLLENLSNKYRVIFHTRNKGKGACIKSALKYVNGEIVLIQDADLEYDPNDYPSLIKPILKKQSKVVFGSRELNTSNEKHSGITFYIGGKILTFLTNKLYNSKLTDVTAGYKVFETEVLENLNIKSKKFDFCCEVAAKLLKRGYKIIEIPISYEPRLKSQGKKIRYRDGLDALLRLLTIKFQ